MGSLLLLIKESFIKTQGGLLGRGEQACSDPGGAEGLALWSQSAIRRLLVLAPGPLAVCLLCVTV